MQHWHLLYTKPGKETLVNAQLEGRNIEAYLPILQFDRGYGRGIRQEPFFPHYLFIYIDLKSQNATDIRWMPGVRTVVHFGDKPVIVPDAVIDNLQKQLEPYEEKVLKKSEWYFKPGQEVKIVKGPFEGSQAVFQRGLNGGQRVEVLLNFLNGWNRTRVDIDSIEPVVQH